MNITALKRNLAALSLTGFLALTLTGCFGDDDADAEPSITPTPEVAVGGGSAGGGGGGVGAGDSGNNDSADDADSDEEQAPEPEPEPAPIALEGAECVYGTWIADNNSALAGMRQFGDEIKSVSGTVVVEYGEDGSLTTDYLDWLINAESEGIAVTIHRSGTDRGTFSATEDTISMTDKDMGATVVMSGEGMNMAVAAVPASYTNAPYTCSANELVINTPDGTAVLTR